MEVVMEDKILICRRISYGPASVPSIPEACYRCGEPVWVAGSSPAHDKVLCIECAAEDTNAKPEAPTKEQMAEVEKWAAGRSSLEVFESVKPEDLESVKGLSIVIERLLDSLRNMRRETPELFFGHPVERLYDSLEAALSCFYRSAVSEERPDNESDPGAN